MDVNAGVACSFSLWAVLKVGRRDKVSRCGRGGLQVQRGENDKEKRGKACGGKSGGSW